MAQDPAPKVRAAVASNMHGCDQTASRRRLIALVRDPSAEVREAVTEPWLWAEAIDRYTFEDIQPCLRDSSSVVRAHSAAWLSTQREDVALPNLLRLTQDKEADVRAAALSALAPFHVREAETALLGALHDRCDDVRIAATATLIGFPGLEIGRALIKLAADPCSRVRRNVARALLGRVESDMFKPLAKLSQDHKDAHLRAAAAKALAGIPGPETDVLLAKLLNDPQEMVRRVARKLLGERAQEVNLPPDVTVELNHPEGLSGSSKDGFLMAGSGGADAWSHFLGRVRTMEGVVSGNSETLPSAVFTCGNGDLGTVMVLGPVNWLGLAITLPGSGRGRKKAPRVAYTILGLKDVQGWIHKMGPTTFHKGESLIRRLGLVKEEVRG
jgi:HEAT repeat protein